MAGSQASSRGRRRPLTSFGLGVLLLAGLVVLVPVVIMVAALLMVAAGFVGLESLGATAVAAIAIALAVLGFLLLVVLAFGAPAGVGMSLGTLLCRADPPAATTRRWWPLVVGVLVVVIVTSLPVVGGWMGTIVALFGLRASVSALRSRRVSEDAGGAGVARAAVGDLGDRH